jgi:hypothetical protein
MPALYPQQNTFSKTNPGTLPSPFLILIKQMPLLSAGPKHLPVLYPLGQIDISPLPYSDISLYRFGLNKFLFKILLFAGIQMCAETHVSLILPTIPQTIFFYHIAL